MTERIDWRWNPASKRRTDGLFLTLSPGPGTARVDGWVEYDPPGQSKDPLGGYRDEGWFTAYIKKHGPGRDPVKVYGGTDLRAALRTAETCAEVEHRQGRS